VGLRSPWLAYRRASFFFFRFIEELEREFVSRRLVSRLHLRHEPIGRNRLTRRAFARASSCGHKLTRLHLPLRPLSLSPTSFVALPR
jgi:hypothetical protein